MSAAVLLALLPVILLIGLGAELRRRRFVADSFWPQCERLGYFVLLPSLFVHGLATAKLQSLPVWALAATLIASTLVIAVLVIAARPLMRVNGPGFTSVFQGSVRFNNYVGVTVAAGLFGAQGVALAAICNAAIVPTVNVLCVLVVARYGSARLDIPGVLKQIATNPLILACGGGILLQVSGVPLLIGLEPALRTLGAAFLPLGLLCVGAALDFSTARQWIGPVAVSSLAKFIAMPLATIVVGWMFDLHGPAFTVALLFQALPTASSAYILARQLGGDAPLMAGITAMQTAIAAAAVPIVVAGLAGVVPP